jgi:hypothetical protein
MTPYAPFDFLEVLGLEFGPFFTISATFFLYESRLDIFAVRLVLKGLVTEGASSGMYLWPILRE